MYVVLALLLVSMGNFPKLFSGGAAGEGGGAGGSMGKIPKLIGNWSMGKIPKLFWRGKVASFPTHP